MDGFFKELYDYIEPYDADWKNRLKPASENLIAEFLKCSRIGQYIGRIPPHYMQFLGRMGQGDGGLVSDVMLGGGEIDINDLMEEFREYYPKYDSDFLGQGILPFFKEYMGGSELFLTYGRKRTRVFGGEPGEKPKRFQKALISFCSNVRLTSLSFTKTESAIP